MPIVADQKIILTQPDIDRVEWIPVQGAATWTWADGSNVYPTNIMTATAPTQQMSYQITNDVISTGSITNATWNTTYNIQTATSAMQTALSNQYGATVSTADIQNNIRITTGANGTNTYTISYASLAQGEANYLASQKLDLKGLMREAIRHNLLIRSGGKRKSLNLDVTPQELKARDTLRDMISEADWRRYMTNGFLMVKGSKDFSKGSAYWYQIHADRSRRVRVYQDGKALKDICIHSADVCPPSDHVINMKVLVEIDEQAVWSGGNVNGIGSQWDQIRAPELKPQTLLEQLRSMKQSRCVEWANAA